MTWVDLLAVALASSVVVNAWLYDNTPLLSRLREYLIAKTALNDDEVPDQHRIRVTLSTGMVCRYCLSHWAPALLLILCVALQPLCSETIGFWLKLPIYSLAATRIHQAIDQIHPDGTT